MEQYIVLVRHECTNPDRLYDASVTRVTHETSKKDDPGVVVIREHEDGWDLATARGPEGLLPGGWLYCCQAEADGLGVIDVFNVNTFVFDENEACEAVFAALGYPCDGCQVEINKDTKCIHSTLPAGYCPRTETGKRLANGGVL